MLMSKIVYNYFFKEAGYHKIEVKNIQGETLSQIPEVIVRLFCMVFLAVVTGFKRAWQSYKVGSNNINAKTV